MVKKRGGVAGRMDREVTKAVPLRKATPWDGGLNASTPRLSPLTGGKEIERAGFVLAALEVRRGSMLGNGAGCDVGPRSWARACGLSTPERGPSAYSQDSFPCVSTRGERVILFAFTHAAPSPLLKQTVASGRLFHGPLYPTPHRRPARLTATITPRT